MEAGEKNHTIDAGLVKVEDSTDPEKPVDLEDPKDAKDPEKPTDERDSGSKKLPKTATTMFSCILAGLLVLLAGILIRRRLS